MRIESNINITYDLTLALGEQFPARDETRGEMFDVVRVCARWTESQGWWIELSTADYLREAHPDFVLLPTEIKNALLSTQRRLIDRIPRY